MNVQMDIHQIIKLTRVKRKDALKLHKSIYLIKKYIKFKIFSNKNEFLIFLTKLLKMQLFACFWRRKLKNL